MSMRKVLALLVVLALSLGLCSIPAGSATLQRSGVTDGSVTGGPTFKDGDGEDIDGGDDDRWGNEVPGGPPDGDDATSGDEEGDDDGSLRMLGRTGLLRIELRTLFGFLVMML